MACEQFIDWNPRPATLVLINMCNTILAELSAYRLTLRQLYYQLVSRNIIPNTERAYKNLSSTMTKARMAGFVDWSGFEDRTRRPQNPTEFDDVADLMEAALHSWRLPRWDGQSTYCELWVEKDALASVLKPLADTWHVTLMVQRGYASASAMYDSADRFIRHQHRRDCRLFYLGDLDPSGEDMVRDIRERLYTFGADVTVEKIAITPAQVEQYNPPPNPAKVTDPRAAKYIEQFGNESWEVDALPPAVLENIITDVFNDACDVEMMDAIITREGIDACGLRAAVQGYLDEQNRKGSR